MYAATGIGMGLNKTGEAGLGYSSAFTYKLCLYSFPKAGLLSENLFANRTDGKIKGYERIKKGGFACVMGYMAKAS